MKDIGIILKKSRMIVSVIEEIISKRYGWIDLIDERLIAHAAYDTLIEFLGSKGKAANEAANGNIIKLEPASNLFRWPLAKFIYHLAVSRLHSLSEPRYPSAVAGTILMLPGVRTFPNLLSRLEGHLKDNYPCLTMTVTGDNIPWEFKQLSNRNGLPRVEAYLSLSDITWFIEIMVKVAMAKAVFIQDIKKQIFSKYGIDRPTVRRKIICRLFYSLFDNIEYALIGKRIAQYHPHALISEIANYGKIAYIMSYVRKQNIMTIGLQHGVMIDPFEYLPASGYFGCTSEYALEKLENMESSERREIHYFICGLPEQLRSKVILTEHGKNGVGLVDSNETIKIYKRQSVDILQKSINIHKLPTLFVKNHPRAAKAMKIEHWLTLQNYKSMGVSSWDDFCGRINIAITFSLDAIYELLIRKVVTIVINPSKRFDTGDLGVFNNLIFVFDASELDSVLSKILDGGINWDEAEEQKLTDYLSYVFGRNDNRLCSNAVMEIIVDGQVKS